jgi:hypothetical protein
MKIKDITFGICSSEVAAYIEKGNRLNYETSALLDEAKKAFDEVIMVHPWHMIYKFLRGDKRPRIIMDDRDISNISCLVVRGTGGYEQSISVFVNAMRLCGCFVLDPMNRFSGETASKLLTTIDRYEKSVGSDSYYAFSLTQAMTLVQELSEANAFPMLTKPITGKKGKDVIVLASKEDATAFAQEFFQNKSIKDVPFFLQPFIKFTSEYRVMLVGEKFIGMAEKYRRKGEIAANAAVGASFSSANDPEIAQFVMEKVNLEGILGVDVARDSEGQIHIIEANRAPLWKEFQQITGINVAKEIVNYARQKCH